MKIVLVHNAYGAFSGEENMVSQIERLLRDHGHEVFPFYRSTTELGGMRWGKARAFFSGIYSPASRRRMARLLRETRSDVVQVQNLYPLISPSVLLAARDLGIPVVMRCANYRLICPNGLLLSGGQICERCPQGREWWCILRNCVGSLPKSVGYALRNWAARKYRLFRDQVGAYICLTEFQKSRLMAHGFPGERLAVIPNMTAALPPEPQPTGDFVGYVGRISPEKGIPTLLGAARRLSRIPFRAAGSTAPRANLTAEAPPNLHFSGHLAAESLRRFYCDSRVLVMPSIWFDTFPNVLIEAMAHAKPVIASRIAGLPEIVDDGVSGLLFEPGNAEDLAQKVQYLWERPDLCRRMGQAGREKVLREYSPQRYYTRLMAVYRQAIECGPPQ